MKTRDNDIIRITFVVLMSAWPIACRVVNTSATSPSAAFQNSPTTLSGRVTDIATGRPIAGAVVTLNGWHQVTTDSSGNYDFPGSPNAGYTWASAENYVTDYRYIRDLTHNVRLYRIEPITAGESKRVTIARDDSLCVNNVQDALFLGTDYVCRSVFVVAQKDGAVTIEAVATQDGAHPPLEVETVGVSPCCSERMGNPTTIQVRVGTVIVANVEMPSNSTTSQSFLVNTSLPH